MLRGGYGVFYTHTVRQGREGLLGFNPPYLVDNLLQTGVTGAAAVASAAPFRLVDGYPSGLLDPNSLAPTVGRRGQDPNQRTPYIQQYNIGVQYELMPDLVLDVAYVGNKGTKLNGFRNLNQRAVITNPDGSQSAGARPYPAFGDIQWMENRVNSSYNSLQMRLDKRFSHGLTATLSYTLGEALSGAPDHISTSGGGAGIDTGVFREPQDANNLRAEIGPAEFDVRHRFVASYVWELPFGHGRRFGSSWNRAMDLAFGGWQVTGIHVLQSGLALTATLGGSTVLNLGGERRARPNLVGNPELPESERTLARWFNTDAFAAFSPAPQAFGNAGVGIMRGPGVANFDFTLAKNFAIDRPAFRPVPHGVFQRLQSRELRPAEHRQGFQWLRPDSDGGERANHPVRVEVLFLTDAADHDVDRVSGRRRYRRDVGRGGGDATTPVQPAPAPAWPALAGRLPAAAEVDLRSIDAALPERLVLRRRVAGAVVRCSRQVRH